MFASSGRIRAVTGLLAVLQLTYASPVAAQAGDRVNADHDFAKFMFEVLDFAAQAEAIHVLSQYCKPPYSPQKGEAQWEIDFLNLMMKRAKVDHRRFERRAKVSFGTSAGMSYIGGFPRVDGIDLSVATFEQYFGAALREIQKVEAILKKKQEQLNEAPLRDCANADRSQTAPPPAPPTPPADPAAGLTRPVPRELIYPELPPYFCSREEKSRFLTDYQNNVVRPARLNGQDANNYDATVSQRANDFDGAGQTAVADQLRRTEGKWAIDNAKAQEKAMNAADAFRQKILAIDIVDCDESGKKIAAAPAPSTSPVRVGLGADFATFPRFKHYVGDQVGIQRYSSNKRVNGLTGFVELQRQDWAYGVGLRTGKHHFAQTFAPGLGLPDQTIGSATGYFVNPYIGRQWEINGRTRFQANTGPVIGLNRLVYRWLFGTEPQEDTRTHFGVQWNVGVAVTLEHPNGWGGRFGADHVGFIESADNYNRLFATGYWRIFGGHRLAGERRELLPRGRRGS